MIRRPVCLVVGVCFVCAISVLMLAALDLQANQFVSRSGSSTLTNRYLLAFHAYSADGPSDPRYHITYIAESDDGFDWSIVQDYLPFTGSVPGIVRRGGTLYIYNPRKLHRYNIEQDTWNTNVVEVSIRTSEGEDELFVDPCAVLDSYGRIVLFYLVGMTNGDPASCPDGVANCTKYFRSATEQVGSDGSSFIVDSGERTEVMIPQGESASDPDIFQDAAGRHILYISRGNSVQALTSPDFRGSYSNIAALSDGYLVINAGGVPAGYYDWRSSNYWTFVHSMSVEAGATVIQRAVTATLTNAIDASAFVVVASGDDFPELGPEYNVASPSFIENVPVPRYYCGLQAPQDVSASPGTYFSKVRVSWSAVSNAFSYAIWRNTFNDTNTASLVGSVTNSYYNDRSALPGTNYHYWVTASNLLGSSACGGPVIGWRRLPSDSRFVHNDFDGDRKTDLAVYEPATGYWYILPSSNLSLSMTKFGNSDCTTVAGDYDGDGKTDLAVFETTTGYWYILPSSTLVMSLTPFGNSGCTPLVGDYDSDGKTDLTVFENATGYWYILLSSTLTVSTTQFGNSACTPVSGDYDGDGEMDLAVYERATGYWYILLSSTAVLSTTAFGNSGCTPLAGDYDGDGKTDLTVFERATGYWYILPSSTLSMSLTPFGNSGCTPLSGDYDGDGKTDLTVYENATGYWYILMSSTLELSLTPFGNSGCVPVQ